MQTAPFHNVFEFAAAVFDVQRETTPDQLAIISRCSDRLFKWSPAGLGLAPVGRAPGVKPLASEVWGVKITGIVEGTDIEHSSAPLMFPFDAAQFWVSCEAANESLDDAKAEWDAQGDES